MPHLAVSDTLRQHRYFESCDVDDTKRRIAQVLVDHSLRPVRVMPHFNAHMDHMSAPGFSLGTIAFGPMDVEVPDLQDSHLLITCTQGQASVRHQGQALHCDASHAVLLPPGAAFVLRTSADCEQLVLRLDRQMVSAHAGHSTLQFAPQLHLDDARHLPWLNHIGNLMQGPRLLHLLQDNPLVAQDYGHLLVSLLLAAQPHDTPAGTGSWRVRPGCVRRADDFIVAHASEPLTLADIARAAEVPTRTLLDNFRRVHGVSPMQRVRDVRLDLCRTALMDPDDRRKVTEVALDHGFSHLGRFAIVYTTRFGEAPSATARRCKP